MTTPKPWKTAQNTDSGDLLMALDSQKSGLESAEVHPTEKETLLNPDSGVTENTSGATTNSTNRNSYGGLGGYGSSYGGMGGMGSMYSGMGGMGGMYGGMGGMGMYGMGGMGMDPNSSFMQTMQFM